MSLPKITVRACLTPLLWLFYIFALWLSITSRQTSFGKFVALLILFELGHQLLISAFEELGWYLGTELHRYRLGNAFLTIAHRLLQIPNIFLIGKSSLCAAELAQLSLFRGDSEKALLWTRVALERMLKTQEIEFVTVSRIGYVLFATGDCERAEKLLMSAHGIRHSSMSKLERKDLMLRSEIQALECVNFDLLGRLNAQAGRISESKKFFQRSLSERLRSAKLRDSAFAYEQDFLLTLERHGANSTEKIEKFVTSAASNLLENKIEMSDPDLTFRTLKNLKSIPTCQALQLYETLLGHSKISLQANQLLDLACQASSSI